MIGYKIGPDLLEAIRRTIRQVLGHDYAFLNQLRKGARANRVPPNVQFVRVTGEPVGKPEEPPAEEPAAAFAGSAGMAGFEAAGEPAAQAEPPAAALWCNEAGGKPPRRMYYPAEVVYWDYCAEEWKRLAGPAWLIQANFGPLNAGHVYLARQVGGRGMIGETAEEPPPDPNAPPPDPTQPMPLPKPPASRPMFATDGGAAGGDLGCLVLQQQTCLPATDGGEPTLKTTCYRVCAPGLHAEVLADADCAATGPAPAPAQPAPSPTPTPTEPAPMPAPTEPVPEPAPALPAPYVPPILRLPATDTTDLFPREF